MKKTLTTLVAILALAPSTVTAQEKAPVKDVTPNIVSPWEKSDGEWITITGKVTEAGARGFKLDYGKGAITVEMDDYDPKLEAFNIIKGDRVVVVGRVDADENQQRTIEAASVYVKSIKKTFFASADDEEESIRDLRKATMNGTRIVLNGTITMIGMKFLTINTGYQLVDVSIERLKTIAKVDGVPEALKSLKIGDKVSVFGAVTDGFDDSEKMIANGIARQ